MYTDNRLTLTSDKPVLSSERAPYIDKTVTFKVEDTSGHEPQAGLDTKRTDWLALTLTLRRQEQAWTCNNPAVSFCPMASHWELKSYLPSISFLRPIFFGWLIIRLLTCFHTCILGGLFEPEDNDIILLKRQLTFNGLHGVTSQKIVLFIRTSIAICKNPVSLVTKSSGGTNITQLEWSYYISDPCA
jgi:hypothetical protein